MYKKITLWFHQNDLNFCGSAHRLSFSFSVAEMNNTYFDQDPRLMLPGYPFDN